MISNSPPGDDNIEKINRPHIRHGRDLWRVGIVAETTSCDTILLSLLAMW